ncbi:ubiquitin carboxyl-terminal hydrolase 5-like isoform X1 [Limulus polyphemus]|uniref:Ubiquitin carboxyl-terminal hydrolase n=1 Tax=Limulus polyphemus TaxID=6850 RepID=A0ABM1BEW5_LIMPO|nr:ubiquitin carboxyl-terminal hydrolase 5-like isoform X1 [Limulus polyphemus]
MEILNQHLSKIRTPLGGEQVFKDECVFSFETPDSENGLFICLNTFLGFGHNHVERHYQKTGNAVYLHIKRIKKELKQDNGCGDETKKPTRLAIGVEGGFIPEEGTKYEVLDFTSIVVLPDFIEIPLPNPDLPELVQLSVASILAAQSPTRAGEASALEGTWDGEKRKVSKYADTLVQLDNDLRIPPKGWKCERCDKTDNLWLNLTDGKILCGRRFFDGSGGNNHAVDHFKETGYPLAVKLGTITPSGGDVFSYDEDDMVEDPNLAKHLAHFGINVTQMEKTEKSMIELEIDMNQRIGEWAILQESGSHLVPMYGPGYTGLSNLGNSCYMNSVMQVVFSIPDFQKIYFENAERIFDSATADPARDFTVQMAKLGHGLLSGDYSKPPPDDTVDGNISNKNQPGIKPSMFKTLIGRGHPEFSTKRQQDAQEYFLHLVNVIERHSRGRENPAECFKFEIEERLQCVKSGKVKYTKRIDYLLSLPIPLDLAVNKDEVAAFEAKKAVIEARGEKIDPNAVIRPKIPLSVCLENFAAPETLEDFFSTAINAKSTALKTTTIKTFPDYLMIQLKKFTLADDWVPKKLDISVDVPDILDLSFLRGKGLQEGEEELPDPKPDEPEFDHAVLTQLFDMGFPQEACKKALYNTENEGIEAAMNWIMEHMNDPDFADPFIPVGSLKDNTKDDFVPNIEALVTIVSMGFSQDQAKKALKETDNNVERALDWIFSHSDELEPTPMETETGSSSTVQFRDGREKYQLIAFISHMGSSTLVGHYVCHILKEGRWVIYNDNKVALSEHPPKDLAYLYVFKRL